MAWYARTSVRTKALILVPGIRLEESAHCNDGGGHDYRHACRRLHTQRRGRPAFFRDVLGFSSVDAGGGWLIFTAPPSELACHPAEGNGKHELYLMCDDLRAEIALLGEKGIACGPVSDQGWGLLSTVRLPGGGDLGLYEPHHPTAYRQSH